METTGKLGDAEKKRRRAWDRVKVLPRNPTFLSEEGGGAIRSSGKGEYSYAGVLGKNLKRK